jgi:hypothetical protein
VSSRSPRQDSNPFMLLDKICPLSPGAELCPLETESMTFSSRPWKGSCPTDLQGRAGQCPTGRWNVVDSSLAVATAALASFSLQVSLEHCNF